MTAQPSAEMPWWKILADNWRGRNGNSTTGDSVRNSCADELEKVATRVITPAASKDVDPDLVGFLRTQAKADKANGNGIWELLEEAADAIEAKSRQVEGAAFKSCDVVARALYAKWCHEADHEPDWATYDKHHSVNPVGLSQYNFIEEAKALLASFPSTQWRRPDETADEYEARVGQIAFPSTDRTQL